MSYKYYVSLSVDLSGVATLVFTVLKLVGVIDWPWIWVLCPLWIGALLTVVWLCVLLILRHRTLTGR